MISFPISEDVAKIINIAQWNALACGVFEISIQKSFNKKCISVHTNPYNLVGVIYLKRMSSKYIECSIYKNAVWLLKHHFLNSKHK